MRLAKVWQGHSRCRPEKFPHGSKMSATLLIDFVIRARCFLRALCGPFLHVCVQCVFTCDCLKSHLEQIADSKPDQPALRDKISIHILVSEQLHLGTAEKSS